MILNEDEIHIIANLSLVVGYSPDVITGTIIRWDFGPTVYTEHKIIEIDEQRLLDNGMNTLSVFAIKGIASSFNYQISEFSNDYA